MDSAATAPARVPLPSERERPPQLGRYVIREEVGQGGMGKVYAAYDPRLDRDVALKVLHRSARGESDWAAVLIREARALARLAHPNVIAVYDVGLVDEDVFIAMELVEGRSLKEWVADRPREWRDVVRLYVEAGRGLAAAHSAGLIHRDFKPENCLFGKDGRVRVLDFGLVRRTKRARPEPDEPSDTFRNILASKKDVPYDSDLAGTPRYMAPELFRGTDVSEQIDQFAFSVALWEALLGTHPFPFETVFQFVFSVTDGKPPLVPEGSTVPAWLLDVLRVGLQADPRRRHASMAAMLAALEEGLSLLGPRSPRIGWRYETTGEIETKARDRLTGRAVAVERTPDRLGADVLARLFTLRHPNIARVQDFGFDDHGTYLVLELPEGTESISSLADRPASVVVPYLLQALRALGYLHRTGLVHGRLHPEHVRILPGHVLLTGLSGAGPGAPHPDLDAFRELAKSLLVEQTDTAWSDALAEPVDSVHALTARLGGNLDVETPESRESILQTMPLTGRSTELAELTAALNEATEGRGSVTLLAGESGAGKSRLLREIHAIAKSRGTMVISGQANASHAQPFTLWREPVSSLALATPLLDEEASIFRLVVPEIERLLGRSVAVPPDLPAPAMQARLSSALLSALARQQGPILFLLEDVHWARSESIALLDGLSEHLDGLPVAVVTSFRDDEGATATELLPAARVVRLERLPQDAVRTLTTTVIGEAARRPEISRFLERETEGNAFFLVEAMRALAEEAGGLERVGDLTSLPKDAGGGSKRALERRLARLPEQDLPLARLAATAGRQIDEALLSALRPETDLAGWLDRARQASVLERREGSYRFSHDKLRESVVASIDEEEAKGLHLEIGDALERLYGDRMATAMAMHYRRAEARDKEARYAKVAGLEALHISPAEARTFLMRALELERETGANPLALARLHRHIGEASYDLADFNGAADHLTSALALLGRAPPNSTFAWGLFAFRQLAVQLWHRLVSKGARDDELTREASRAAGRLAKLWAHRPSPVRLMSLALLAVNLAERAGGRNVYALGMLGYATGTLGLKKLPASYFAEARKEEAESEERVEALVMEAIYLGASGRKAQTLETIEQGLDLARARGDGFGLASLEAVRGLVLWFFGRVSEVSASYDRAVRAIETGDHGHRATFLVGQALGLYLDGAIDTAAPIAEEALAGISEMDHSIRASGLAVKALIDLELGRVDTAVRAADDILEIFSSGALVAPIFFHVPMACFEAHRAAGHTTTLERVLEFERAWAGNTRLGEPQVLLHEGVLLRMKGREEAAVRSLERGWSRARDLGAIAYAGLCALELGRRDEATVLFEEADFGLGLARAGRT